MTIDAAKLKEAIKYARLSIERAKDRECGGTATLHNDWLELVTAAAAATLPREMEIAGWALVHIEDRTWSACLYPTEDAARNAAGSSGDVWQPVRLTGTALLPPAREGLAPGSGPAALSHPPRIAMKDTSR
jgi:hypothetical protein